MDINKTAVLVIDMQKESKMEIVNFEHIVKKNQLVIDASREKEIPIIYTRHINRSDSIGIANNEPVTSDGQPVSYSSDTRDIEILESIQPKSTDIVIDKYRYSAFFESSLDIILRNLGINHLIVSGVLTDCCVLATVYDAYFRDYQVNFISDACGTTTEGAHMAATLMMANWVYDFVVFETRELLNMFNGEKYWSWETHNPDELQFSTDNLKQVYSRLENSSRRC